MTKAMLQRFLNIIGNSRPSVNVQKWQRKVRKLLPINSSFAGWWCKNEVILTDLVRQDFFISVGASILRGGKWATLLPKIPIEKLLLETDNTHFTIQSIYEKVSQILNIDLDILQENIFKNYKNLIAQ